MHDPDSYDANSEFQRADAAELVPRLVSSMGRWGKGESILDFGSGSGFITRHILLPALATTYPDPSRSLTATDISAEMISFARAKYPHPRVNYVAIDISAEASSLEWKFDKIFSFHTLHWIPDVRQGLNISFSIKLLQIFHGLLNPLGEIGLYFIGGTAPVFSAYDSMSREPKWSEYLHDVGSFIPKTFYSADPAADMRQMLQSLKFKVQRCEILQRNFHFQSPNEMIDAAMAANPFIQRIPEDLVKAYKEDFMARMMTYVDFAPTLDLPDRLNVSYQVLYVHVQKQ